MVSDYTNSKIYKISSSQTDNCYIGSTVQSLQKRMNQHKSFSNCTTSKEILKFDDAVITLVEEYPCKSKQELIQREMDIIKTTTNCINKVNTVGNMTEYKDYIIHQDENHFLVLSGKTKTLTVVLKSNPTDTTLPDTRVLTPSNLFSAIREYEYDIRRKQKKYYQYKKM